MESNTIILSSNGILNLQINQQYRVDDILNLDNNTVKAFCDILNLNEIKRYQILYSLAINNLLIVPDSQSTPLQWIKNKSYILKTMDDILITSKNDNSYALSLYNLSLTGKRSDIFRMLDNIVGDKVSLSHFERSFHILPNTFIGGYNRITDLDEFRNKIKALIEPNFALNEVILEKTFKLIDELYFNNLMKYRLQAAGKKISFRISDKMVGTAGSMTSKKDGYIIAISNKLSEVLGNKNNSGIIINGPIDAFIVTLQHEITHLIVYLEIDRLGLDNTGDFSSHGLHFKDISLRYFGLTERTHCLFESGDALEQKMPVKNQLNMGTRVYFDSTSKKGALANQRVYGKIIKLNPKNAQVGLEKNDKIYNVPYELLHVA